MILKLRCDDHWTNQEGYFITKTVAVGESIILKCSRLASKSGYLFWMKLVPGKLPEVLAATYTFDTSSIIPHPGVTTYQEPGAFVLHLRQIKLSDSAFYYCDEVHELKKMILNITFIRVKELYMQEFGVQKLSHPGDSVTRQCSALADAQMCPDNYTVYWLRDDTNGTPSVMCLCGTGENCERSPEEQASQKCVHNFSKSKISPADGGASYCAVVTRGHILFGKETQLENEVLFFLLGAALSASLVVTVILFCKIKKLQLGINDTLVYSVPNFIRNEAGRRLGRGENPAEVQIIYGDVRALEYE
uniref:Immunoglobulin V-set domain-containing protein n=1 Tax=Nothobranchius furzeri TaxID=105023 RepID=A0A8C6KJ23_NOTFU